MDFREKLDNLVGDDLPEVINDQKNAEKEKLDEKFKRLEQTLQKLDSVEAGAEKNYDLKEQFKAVGLLAELERKFISKKHTHNNFVEFKDYEQYIEDSARIFENINANFTELKEKDEKAEEAFILIEETVKENKKQIEKRIKGIKQIVDHDKLKNLGWSMSGHVIDRDVDMMDHSLINLRDPKADQEAATKIYVDMMVQRGVAMGQVAGAGGGSTPTPGATSFLNLTDTPATYAGQAGKVATVNATETGLEFIAGGAGADVKVAIDAAATAGYLGAASGDGVLRTDATLDYTDGGDFVTLGLEATLKSNYDAAYSHVSADGSSHSFIDQDVTIGSSPTLDGTNFTGIPLAGVAGIEASTAAGQLLFGDAAGGWQHTETTEMLWDDVNKRLGIGTATPRQRADILDASGIQQRFTHTDNSVFTDVGTTAAGVFQVLPEGSAMEVDITGNTQSVLRVKNTDSGALAYAGVSLESEGGTTYLYRTSNAYTLAAYQDDFVIQEAGGGDIVFFTAGEAVRVYNNGKVKIGAGTDASLTAGTLYLTEAGNTVLSIRDSTNDIEGYHMVGTSGTDTGYIFGSVTNHPMFLRTNNTTAITIDTSQNVGINTANPRRRLDALDASNPQIRWTHTDNSIYGELQVDASGITTLATTGNSFVFPAGSAANPSLAFRAGCGFYESAGNTISFSTGGVRRGAIDAAGLFMYTSGGSLCGLWKTSQATATVASMVPRYTDDDTGIGSAGVDQLSLIAGGVEGQRIVEDTTISTHFPETSTPTAIADYWSIYGKTDNKLYFQDGAGTEHTISTNYTKTLAISPSGGDYTTIQAALDANTAGGELFLVYPGTYTDTINFTANNQVVKGMGFGNNCIVQQTSATICDFSSFTGCRVTGLKLEITAADGADNVVQCSTGSGVITNCKLICSNVANITGTQPRLINVSGAGSIITKFGEFEYYNTGDANGGSDVKTAFFCDTGGFLHLKRPCQITVTNSGTALATTMFYSTSSGMIEADSICDATVTDTDATLVIGLGYIGAGAGSDEFYRNTIHVVGGASNAAYGVYHAGTGTLRSAYNHFHITDGGGSSYGFLVGAGATLTSQLDDVIAADGNQITGTFTQVNSPADGDFTVSGTITGDVTGDLTGNADTVSTIAGLAPDTATTQATQAAITTCANLTTVGTLSAGNATAIVDAATLTVAGKIEIATAAETTTGTDATRAVSPDGLAGSDYGKRTFSVLVNDSTALTSGDGKAYFPRIPAELNGWNIVGVAANMVAGTGLVTIQIHNLTQTADVLSTELTIDANEKDSKDATTPAVIDTAEDDVATGDRLRVDIDGAGTGTTWLDVQITMQLP